VELHKKREALGQLNNGSRGTSKCNDPLGGYAVDGETCFKPMGNWRGHRQPFGAKLKGPVVGTSDCRDRMNRKQKGVDGR